MANVNPLFDMLAGMQQQAARNPMIETMAKQYGLQQGQVEKAMEALMPAFSQGLKRNVSSPQGFAQFMQALASGNHQRYMQNPADAMSKNGISEGNAILGHLFGNKDVSRAVAKQAEAASGISQSILRQMLPALAPMVMGGLFQQMTGSARTAQASNAFGGGNILGEILEQMMRQGMGGSRGRPTGGRPRSAQKSPLEEILEQMMGGGQRPAGTGRGGQGSADQLGDIFRDMLRGGPARQGSGNAPYEPLDNSRAQERDMRRPDPYGRPQPDPEPVDPAPRERGPEHGYPRGTGLEDLFGDLFKPTRGATPEYEKAIEDIFDQFMGKR